MKHQWSFERSQFTDYQHWLTTINTEITQNDVNQCALCHVDTSKYPLALQPFPKSYDFLTSDQMQASLCQTCLDSIFIDYASRNQSSCGCFIYLPESDQMKLNYFINCLKYDDEIATIDKKGFYTELKLCQNRWLDVCGIDISDPFYFKLFYQQHINEMKHLLDKACFLPNLVIS
ncbi:MULTISPECIES: hypothetical protein [Cysteiniphilum]|uniref:hypothetical protein n=1 Tax=Cysteiniphilum TaxID=2056696 RepID=UPI001783FE2C|nr:MULTISPECIES: hypothetical protein [Cysteiniphilum]